MAEYIEREALMRRIKEIHCAECDSYHGVRCRACWVDDTLDYIDSEPAADVATVQEWISVTDRLPDKDGCYIVTACDEGCSCGDGIWYDTVVIEAEHYKGEWSWNENGTEYDITDLVTHWMPMPNPPKGE